MTPQARMNIERAFGTLSDAISPQAASERRAPDIAAPSGAFSVTGGSAPVFGAWKSIETLPKDGLPVLVWAEGLHWPDVAWYEKTDRVRKTYTHWTPFPDLPNASSRLA